MQSFLILILIKIFIQQLQYEFVLSSTSLDDFRKSVELAKDDIEWIKTASELYNIDLNKNRIKRRYEDDDILNNLMTEDKDDTLQSINGDAWYKNFCNAGAKKLIKVKESDRKHNNDDNSQYKGSSDSKYYSKQNYPKDDFKDDMKEEMKEDRYTKDNSYLHKPSWMGKTHKMNSDSSGDKKTDDQFYYHKYSGSKEDNVKQNDLSHEANYKLSKIEQDASEKSSNAKNREPLIDKYILFPVPESSISSVDKPDLFSIMDRKVDVDKNMDDDYGITDSGTSMINQIKLKTSAKLMNKGYGASLPSDFIEHLKYAENLNLPQHHTYDRQDKLHQRHLLSFEDDNEPENENPQETESQIKQPDISDVALNEAETADQSENEIEIEQDKRDIFEDRVRKKAKMNDVEKVECNLENLINGKTPFHLIGKIFEMVQQNELKDDLWPALKINNEVMQQVIQPWTASSECIKFTACITLPDYLRKFYDDILKLRREKLNANDKNRNRKSTEFIDDINNDLDKKMISKHELIQPLTYSIIREKYDTIKKLLRDYDYLSIKDQNDAKDIKNSLEKNLSQIRKIQSKDERKKRLIRSNLAKDIPDDENDIAISGNSNISLHYQKLFESAKNYQKFHLNTYNDDYEINLFI